MADSVPACDVLCEAMEYLSKLGSNLRLRSDNLKEKRIKKEKLRNVHAVQKAANKVLLICELSKKSIQNVETGIKNILTQIVASQVPIDCGGKNDDKRSTSSDDVKYEYFHYESQRLRIRNRVNVNHYTSVKVLVKSMATGMQDKYPVYHDCKLYRLRKDKFKDNKESEVIDSSRKDNPIDLYSTDDCQNIENISKLDFGSQCLEQTKQCFETNNKDDQLNKIEEKSKKNEEISLESNPENTGKIKNKKVYFHGDDKSRKISSDSDKTKKYKHIKIFQDSSDSDKDKEENYKMNLNSEDNANKSSSEKICNKNIEKVNFVNVGDDQGTVSINSNINNVESNIDENSVQKGTIKDIEDDTLSKTTPGLNVIIANKKDQNKDGKDVDKANIKHSDSKKIDTENENNLNNSEEEINDYPNASTMETTQNVVQYDKKKDEKKTADSDVKINLENENSMSSVSDRSYIKCVNINKLLRKDILPKCEQSLIEIVDSDSDKETKIVKNNKCMIKEKLNHTKKKKHKAKRRKIEYESSDKTDDDEYWKQKREEVKSFKAKKIVINITSFPKLTCKYLYMNKLQRITQNGKVICELNNDFKEPKEKTDNLNTPSDSETIKSNENNMFGTNESKDCEKSGKPVDNNQIKSSLLHDSTDDSTPTKRKSLSDITSPPSKRKHIMESMHAKKMLLTYSSSSDTEDEQLRNALKGIRESLLKGVSSDEEIDNKKNKLPKNDLESEDTSQSTQGQDKESLYGKASETNSSAKDTNSQIDTNTEEKSNSCSEKMGRSKSYPSGSSSQNSDTQESYDKEIDGLTNLSTLIKKRRHRRSTSSHSTQSSNSKNNKMSKAPLISEEGFLKAESSDAASLADSDVGEEVEIPAVSMSSLNGDSIGHLAKDDLLEESDSSSSQNKSSSQDIKKEEESDNDNLKSKRRKAHVISSDSEAGGSRRRNRDRRLSDFEDSEFESSEPAHRSKRKKKGSDSDASAGSSTDGKKKRRRIRNIDDSDISGSESENEGRNKHGRKNIRKVMGKNQLEEATKKAAREEKERVARIAERQKLYNNLQFDESGKPDEVVLDKVVLDFDPETKEPLIEVDKGLVKKLKPHQANGIKFMWDACFESVKRIKKDKGSGCILAHCMGLGKTLQVVSLTHSLLLHSALTGVNRVLVVCPLSTVLNWVNEYHIWLKHAEADNEVDVYELSRFKQNSERAWQLQQWVQGGGVCVLGYEMFRNLSADNGKKFKKKMLRSFQEALVDPGPDLVVCDEGHLLKNEKTSLSQAMNRVKTLRRIVLTGTPLQNNLKEYYCMVQFVKPNLLGKYNEYLNRFVNPITNGQYTDSTEHDIRVMKRRSHVLHKMLDGAVQRRDYGVLAPFLPPKHEYVLFITLSEVQIKLYQHYLDNYSRRPLAGKSSGFLFPDFQSLQRIWTHPLVLKYNSEKYEIMQKKKREREEEEDSENSLADFIDDDSTPDESSTEESSDSLSDMSDDSRKKNKKKKSAKKGTTKESKATTRRGTRANPGEASQVELCEEEAPEPEPRAENPTEWWMSLVGEDELDDMRHSHKLVLLFDILRQCEAIGDKLLVFSQSLYSLDLIEHFLSKVDEATQEGRVDEKLNGLIGSWSPGVDYFRLDGSTSCDNRSIWCKNFNREDNPRARLFLISTRAGGLGINLVAANRVVIFDVSWNPSHDVQSIFRVYRFGQKKPCYIYRFLAMGTMEEKIYERQVTKQAISKRVIDEQQIDRHYAENDLAELYKFEPQPPQPRELPPLPKDRLFAEMLKDYEAQIYKYHEHDSMLENKEEETLTEEERKAAWEDFENEKTRPPPVPFNAYGLQNGMMPGLLAQQQQQLAYAALAAMLRKERPNINDNQIRDALMYNVNPVSMFGGYDYGLMQKMSELYKFNQGGMMNPAMMNQIMNAAGVGGVGAGVGGGVGGGGGGGMALGGSSSLQYEPPWLRQQKQMRMQQMLQQQNMGTKYYAGGIGSRDPVAMQLQQQLAREMMLGERTRPRGRPPSARAPAPASAPAPAPGDVVNLDSD